MTTIPTSNVVVETLQATAGGAAAPVGAITASAAASAAAAVALAALAAPRTLSAGEANFDGLSLAAFG